MAACVWLSKWQWDRAGSNLGTAANVGYGLQWPFFALFFGYMWWRFLRLEVRRLEGEEPEEHETPAVPTAEPRAPKEIDPVPLAPETTAPEPRANDAATTEDDREPAPWDRGPSPFTPTPVPAAKPVTDDEDPRLAAYNRMLAQLAARDQET
ncbi:hypothetical protein [Pseudonocardia sp. T1-2H]|uniref:hypothetical protein n=1 Tax=Pseudonocardia sp. T1-2H TaxID=3128899 RepID=UPI003101810F